MVTCLARWSGNALSALGGKHEKPEKRYGIYAFRYRGTRSLFVVTDDGVIATDPVSVDHSKILREEIAKVTDQPVKYVVYSHYHWDHVPGGQIFKDEGVVFIAQENCAREFNDNPHPDIVMPNINFSDDYTLKLGGRSLELLYSGPNHGECMVAMRPDPGDYIFVVDLVTPGAPRSAFFPTIHRTIGSARSRKSKRSITKP